MKTSVFFGYGKLAVLASLGTTAVFALTSFWKSGKHQNKPKGLCAGLLNIGNSCFVNSILQALSACNGVTDWLKHFIAQCDVNSHLNYIANTLHDTVSHINHDSEDITNVYNASKLLGELRRRRWHISAHEHDAHEFFHVVMETLDEEIPRRPNVVSLFDTKTLETPLKDSKADKCACSRFTGWLPIFPCRTNGNPFRGLLATQLKCTTCNYHRPVTYATFDSLSLCIPTQTWGTVTLRDLLTNFIQSEMVSDVECPGCAKQQGLPKTDPAPRTTFIKKSTLAKLPQSLCLHIQRTVWLDEGVPVKCFNRILFPEYLSLDEYAYVKRSIRTDTTPTVHGGHATSRPRSLHLQSSPSPTTSMLSPPLNLLRALNFQSQTPANGFLIRSPTVFDTATSPLTDLNQNTPDLLEYMPKSHYLYKLVASVCHIGEIHSGHFITFRRAPSKTRGVLSDKWLYTSDSEVHLTSLPQVKTATDVYMLFYERSLH